MAKKVLLAMSGGVDSSVAAYLLKEQGYEVTGVTIRTWAPDDCDEKSTRSCCGTKGVEDARAVAVGLGLKYNVMNMSEIFKTEVIDYFVDEYQKGRTPNPCIACNEKVKIGLFWEKAKSLGMDYVATGHYARVQQETDTGRYHISRGVDDHKDQSYVMFPLKQEVLSRLLLPVGELKKDEVREIAKKVGMGVHNKPDSQEICFIPSNDYAAFMKKNFNVKTETGDIKTVEGEVLGKHPGYQHFTIGQRRGLGVAYSYPLYVVDIKPETNEVIVGDKSQVKSPRFVVNRLIWHMNPRKQFNADVKIRSAHAQSKASIECDSEQSAVVTFDEPQEAITPGQAAVFYDEDKVIAGGWIDQVQL